LAQLVAVPGEATVLVTAQHPEAIPVEIEVVLLAKLDPNAFDALVRLGLPPGMAELTGGVPLLLVEWLRARHEEAEEATLEARLALLPEAARAVLEGAAVAGAGVPTPVLAQIVGVADPGRAIAELALRGFVHTGGSRVRTGVEIFSPTLRERIYTAMGEERQQALHVALAKTLHERGDDPIVVAHHAHLASGAPSVMLERAGDAAREGFDDDASARWYRLALDRGRQALALGKGDEARQIRIALKLGLVQRYRGEVLQSEQVLREALDLAASRGDRWAEVQARRGLARLALNWQNLEGAREQLVAAVAAALGGGDRNNLTELYVDLADTLMRLGDEAAAESELWEGLMLVTGGDGPEAETGPDALWRMLHLLAELARRAGRHEQARAYGLHGLRHAERIASPLARARVHALLGTVFQDLGDGQRAAEHRRSAVEAMRSIGDRRSTAELLLLLADPDAIPAPDARAWLKEADALAHQVGWQEGVERSRAALAQLP
jgi:tetratricopeptide (TPR) repeat protein